MLQTPMDHLRYERGNKNLPKDKWKHADREPMKCSKHSSKKEVYSDTNLPQEIRKISNKQPKLTLTDVKERRTNKTQSRREKNIRSEQNKWTRDQKKKKRLIKLKTGSLKR